jgi:hypothetical protein
VTGVVLVAENLRDTGLAVGVLYRRLTGEAVAGQGDVACTPDTTWAVDG